MSYSTRLAPSILVQNLSAFALITCLTCSLPAISSAEQNSPEQSNPNQTTASLSNESADQMKTIFDKSQSFSTIYEKELGKPRACNEDFKHGIKFCFDTLKNDGNAPFILLPTLSQNRLKPRGVVVLFHGLSDSPYFMSSIGEFLRSKGYIVIAPLTPGHGKIDANADMQDDNLKARWNQHTDQVMSFAMGLSKSDDLPLVIGGFSTGGAFATQYTVNHPNQVAALLLFSGALELSGAAESMSSIWGMKTIAKWLDGDYKTEGGHPYKYPSVASYSGLVLMDIIQDIRDDLDGKKISKPIFAAHSLADSTTLFSGIEWLTTKVKGQHTVFKIDESYDLCHADVPISTVQIVNLKFDKSKVNASEKCVVPKANPLHGQMLLLLDTFLTENVAKT